MNSIASSSNSAGIAERTEIVDAGLRLQQAKAQDAQSDQNLLSNQYVNAPLEQITESLSRTRESLQEYAGQLGSAVGGSLAQGDRARFQNLYMNAADKADFALQGIQAQRAGEEALAQNSAFGSLFTGKGPNSSGTKIDPNGLFNAAQVGPATTNDALVNRLILFNGLPPDARQQLFNQLRLTENANLKLATGVQVNIPILHNGYIFGGLDCSSFVSSLLPADVRKGSFTTLDFRAMWVYRRTGVFPNPPSYSQDRGQLIKKVSDSFIPINIYVGERLEIGDLLVYRLSDSPIGHVFIVKNFNPATMMADVIEASQSAGSIRSRDLNLAVKQQDGSWQMRVGLLALRLKPVSNRGCSYKDRHGKPEPIGTFTPEPPAPAEPRQGKQGEAL
ncbi:MAG: hypothetical protein ACXWPM_10395 [Bdellovibrionota bacterium]